MTVHNHHDTRARIPRLSTRSAKPCSKWWPVERMGHLHRHGFTMTQAYCGEWIRTRSTISREISRQELWSQILFAQMWNRLQILFGYESDYGKLLGLIWRMKTSVVHWLFQTHWKSSRRTRSYFIPDSFIWSGWLNFKLGSMRGVSCRNIQVRQ